MIYNNEQAFVITGAPGTGKTTLIESLKQSGLVCIAEPARSIIEEQRAIDGEGVYDKSPFLFKELMLSRMMYQFKQRMHQGVTIFDRGIPDMLAYSQCFDLSVGAEQEASKIFRYALIVFLAPCWEDIFENDADRQLSFNAAQSFECDLRQAYKDVGYELLELPKDSVEMRKQFVLEYIG